MADVLYLPSIRIDAFKPQMGVRVMDASQICQALSPDLIGRFWQILEGFY